MSSTSHSERARAFIDATFSNEHSLQNLLTQLEDLDPTLKDWQWKQIRLLDGSTGEGCIKDVFNKDLAQDFCWARTAKISQNALKLLELIPQKQGNILVRRLIKEIDCQAIKACSTLESRVVPAYYLER